MRFGRFVVIGAVNTMITLAVFNVLAVLLSTSAAVANVVAYSIGIANSYFWNSRWTFADRVSGPAAFTTMRFVVVNLVGLVITTAAVWVLAPLSPATLLGVSVSGAMWLNVAEGAAIIAGLIWNYSMSSRWVFINRPSGPA